MSEPHLVIPNPTTYFKSWKAWWTHCQPPERTTASWPFPHNALSTAQWNKFLSGGKHGIFLFIMALSWWVRSSDSTPPDLAEAVSDLVWVLQQLKDSLATPPSNHSSSVALLLETPNTSRGKRKVILTEKALTADEDFRKRFCR